MFYARPPYLNTDLGAGAHVTRFVGLASVGNMAKQKSLHALGLMPASNMEIETLQQKPEVRTSSLQKPVCLLLNLCCNQQLLIWVLELLMSLCCGRWLAVWVQVLLVCLQLF
jgi:hypothetical protein